MAITKKQSKFTKHKFKNKSQIMVKIVSQFISISLQHVIQLLNMKNLSIIHKLMQKNVHNLTFNPKYNHTYFTANP